MAGPSSRDSRGVAQRELTPWELNELIHWLGERSARLGESQGAGGSAAMLAPIREERGQTQSGQSQYDIPSAPQRVPFDRVRVRGPLSAEERARLQAPVTPEIPGRPGRAPPAAALPPALAPGQRQPGTLRYPQRTYDQGADAYRTAPSMSIPTPRGEALVPRTRDDGTMMSRRDAWAQHRTGGPDYGVFDSPEAAAEHARRLGMPYETYRPPRPERPQAPQQQRQRRSGIPDEELIRRRRPPL